MINFINLRAVAAYKERQKFLSRHMTKGDVLVLGFGLGCAFMSFVFAGIAIALRSL